MEEQHLQQVIPVKTEETPRDWKLTIELAGGGGVILFIMLLLTQSGFGTSLFFGCISAFACGLCGPDMLAPLLDLLPKRKELPQLSQRKEPKAEKPLSTTTRKIDNDVDFPIAPPKKPARAVILSSEVQAALSDLAGKAIFVCGIRRHGKTTLGARLAEQLGNHYIPLFIPCLEGDYLSLADVLPRSVIAGHSSGSRHYTYHDFAPLDNSQEAFQLGNDILEKGYQVILDLNSYRALDEAIAIQINVIRGMFHWANTHPDNRVTSHVYLDEAQRYLPQNLSESVIQDRVVLDELLRTYMDIIAIGGKRGIAPVILTQRFAQVNKKIMAQSEVFFLMRQTNDGDLDRCMEYVNKESATRDDISKFQPGQGVYIAYDGSQCVTHFHQRESSGKRSSTPEADAAMRYKTMPLYYSGTTVTKQLAPSSEIKGTRVLPQIEEMEELPTNRQEEVEPEELTQKLSLELQMALNVYEPWMGYRDLGKALHMGKDKAGELLKELKERRLIA